ncbi:MAG: hypothetical protein QNJ72_14640 [Pleurocapsa sp. MO_226.B13]|nr:hypothetical protein [Pleurocapsa sp. MO_226.B13]
MVNFNNPRQKAKEAIRASILADLWLANSEFVARLSQKVRNHRVATHPAIELLNSGAFNREQMVAIHLDYRQAIVQIFTDALLMAQYQTCQLEPRLPPGSKMYARFLITLNDLDEFGFRPGLDKYGYYLGNPSQAHYPLFEEVLDRLGVSQQQRKSYAPTKVARHTRQFLANAFRDLCSVVSLLAVAEEEVVLFSAPLRENTRAVGIDVSSGYYACHGSNEDLQADARDDDHANDLWYVLTQALTPQRYGEIEKLTQEYCDIWVKFWDAQISLLQTNEGHSLMIARPV